MTPKSLRAQTAAISVILSLSLSLVPLSSVQAAPGSDAEKTTPERLQTAFPDDFVPVLFEMLGDVLCKGLPRQETFDALDSLADVIAQKHAGLRDGA